MIKNVFIFTLLQIYVVGKKYDLRKGGWKKYDFQCNIQYLPLLGPITVFCDPPLKCVDFLNCRFHVYLFTGQRNFFEINKNLTVTQERD